MRLTYSSRDYNYNKDDFYSYYWYITLTVTTIETCTRKWYCYDRINDLNYKYFNSGICLFVFDGKTKWTSILLLVVISD